MIARPVHRPRPIPFDTAATAGGNGSQTRAVSWTGNLGPASHSVSNSASHSAGVVHMPPRLSPVKAPLPCGPVPFSSASAGQAPKRSLHAVASVGHAAGHSAAHTSGHSAGHSAGHSMSPSTARPAASAASHTSGPRPHAHTGGGSMSEISARYIGQGALSVRSSVTGRHYRFQGHGDSLVIDRNDVVLLKRISDLVIR